MMKAIVFIDVQNDFVKGGKLAFGYPTEDNLQKIVDFAKSCVEDPACKIYATRDTHEATKYIFHFDGDKKVTEPQTGYLATLEGQKLPIEHCIEGEYGWQIVDSLMDVLLGKATFINKPTFGSYDFVSVVQEDFRDEDPEEIILVGYDLSICVLANAILLRAKYPNVKITVKTGLCGDIDEAAFNAAVKVLQMQQIDVESN